MPKFNEINILRTILDFISPIGDLLISKKDFKDLFTCTYITDSIEIERCQYNDKHCKVDRILTIVWLYFDYFFDKTVAEKNAYEQRQKA